MIIFFFSHSLVDTRISRFVSLKKPLFSSRTFYFSFVLFINIPRKNFMADWCVRLEFESVHQVCDCFVVPLSLRTRASRIIIRHSVDSVNANLFNALVSGDYGTTDGRLAILRASRRISLRGTKYERRSRNS